MRTPNVKTFCDSRRRNHEAEDFGVETVQDEVGPGARDVRDGDRAAGVAHREDRRTISTRSDRVKTQIDRNRVVGQRAFEHAEDVFLGEIGRRRHRAGLGILRQHDARSAVGAWREDSKRKGSVRTREESDRFGVRKTRVRGQRDARRDAGLDVRLDSADGSASVECRGPLSTTGSPRGSISKVFKQATTLTPGQFRRVQS